MCILKIKVCVCEYVEKSVLMYREMCILMYKKVYGKLVK